MNGEREFVRRRQYVTQYRLRIPTASILSISTVDEKFMRDVLVCSHIIKLLTVNFLGTNRALSPIDDDDFIAVEASLIVKTAYRRQFQAFSY